ncbi:MAG TPA: ABC transporter permease [Vicinamibacterales bacterium]|jgi:predicted permease|nr:ABC transporter permease [Vicinamibacterales bacterium]
MSTLGQDLRYAVRAVAKSPGFTALAVGCLALGIGVNSAIFSIVDTVAIRALPFHEPDRLVTLETTHRANGIQHGNASFLDVRDWKARTSAFADIAAVNGRSLTLSDGGEPERFNGATVTWNLFTLIGVQPMLGRQMRQEEDQPGGPRVVVLSHGVWQRRYAGDRSVIGRTITVNGNPHTVIGVMPPKFQFPEQAQLWIPQTPIEYASLRTTRNLQVIARLKPDASLAAARNDMAAVAEQLVREQPDDQGWSASARLLRDWLVPSDLRLIVLTMMGAVSLVLLIACANVANLLLSRATVRQREIAVRVALGAGRGRIVRQLLTESLLLALASAPLGVGVAYAGLVWLTSSIPPVPYYIDWSMNPRIVAYTGAIALLTGVLFGLAPALQAARADVQESLKDRGRGSAGGAGNRLRNALVVTEVALSLVLLVGASLFVRSFLNLQESKAGFDTDSLLTMRFYMPGDQYDPPEAMVRRVQDVVRRVEALPGVVSALASNMVPLVSGGSESAAVPEGVAMTPGQEPNVNVYGVTPHLLRTLGVPLVAGRDFTAAEGLTRSAVAIVNGVFAKRLWPNRTDVVGQRFRRLEDKPGDWITVIGVIGDFRLFTVRGGSPPAYVFLSYPYDPTRNTGLTIRVAGASPASITSAVRQEIRSADPTLPLFSIQTGEEARASSFWVYELFGWMFSIFGGIALTLASIGVYGVLSYAVAQRTQEIGVRIALGASRRDVFRLIVGDGAKLAGAGILLGIVGAFGVTRVVASFLYNVTATDPASFVATALGLIVVALIASYVPARRATSVDPMIALREPG